MNPYKNDSEISLLSMFHGPPKKTRPETHCSQGRKLSEKIHLKTSRKPIDRETSLFVGVEAYLTEKPRFDSVGPPRPMNRLLLNINNSTPMTSAWPTSIPKGPKIHVVRTPKKTRKTSSQFLRSRNKGVNSIDIADNIVRRVGET